MPWFSFDISVLCGRRVLVTAWGLFIGVEGIPEHLPPLCSQDSWGWVPLGDALGCSGDPPGIRDSALSFYDSAVFICTRDRGGQSPSLSDF